MKYFLSDIFYTEIKKEAANSKAIRIIILSQFKTGA